MYFCSKKADDVAKFTTETIDLGTVTQNQPATAVFEVTNISKEPLLIETANPTCGCTISDFTKTPIEPGKVGTIKATYNAKNLNAFEKHLTVKFAGVEDLKSITIKGNVVASEIPAEKAEAAPAKEIPREEIGGDLKKETEADKTKDLTEKKGNEKKANKVVDKKAPVKPTEKAANKAAETKKIQDKKPQ